jgi:hypothetical protein
MLCLFLSKLSTSIDFLKVAKLVIRCIKLQPWHVYIWSDVSSVSQHYVFPLFDTLGTQYRDIYAVVCPKFWVDFCVPTIGN